MRRSILMRPRPVSTNLKFLCDGYSQILMPRDRPILGLGLIKKNAPYWTHSVWDNRKKSVGYAKRIETPGEASQVSHTCAPSSFSDSVGLSA